MSHKRRKIKTDSHFEAAGYGDPYVLIKDVELRSKDGDRRTGSAVAPRQQRRAKLFTNRDINPEEEKQDVTLESLTVFSHPVVSYNSECNTNSLSHFLCFDFFSSGSVVLLSPPPMVVADIDTLCFKSLNCEWKLSSFLQPSGSASK